MEPDDEITTLRKKSRNSLLQLKESLPPDEVGHQSHKHGWFHVLKSFPTNDGCRALKQVFPIISQLQKYSFSTFLADFRSAVTVSFVLLPQAIAYAPLANVPPISALLSCVFPLIVYSLLGSSGQLGIGTEALTSVLTGLAVHEELIVDPEADPAMIASAIGVLSGILGILLAVLQAGYIDNVLSGYLLTGFVLGVSNIVMVEQLPGLFGLKPAHHLETESAAVKLYHHLKELPTANVPTVVFGLCCLGFLFTTRYLKKRLSKRWRWMAYFPDILLLVIASIAVSAGVGFEKHNIKILGPIASSLIPPRFPTITWDFLNRNIASIITVTIAGFVESQTVTRNFGLMNNYFPSGDRELFALGTSNLIGGLFGGYVAYGSLPRSKIQAVSGAKTTATGFFTALLVLTYFSLLGDVFRFLPKAALAAVVFIAAYGLIEFDEIGFIFRMRNYQEILKFLATYLITIFFSASTGILLCLLLAGLVIIQRSTSLSVSLLGEVKVGDAYRGVPPRIAYVDVHEHPEAHIMDKILAIQVRGSLEFFNASRIARRIEMLTEAVARFNSSHEPRRTGDDFDPKLLSDLLFIRCEFPPEARINIILDFKNVEDMDSSAVWILLKIIKRSKRLGTSSIYCTGLHEYQVEIFEKSGVLQELSPGNVFEKVEDAIGKIRRESTQQLLARQSFQEVLREGASMESLKEVFKRMETL